MVENVITSRLEIQGYENIKQIKDEITKLRQQMKELATGTEEYKETADQLVRTEYDLKQAMAAQKKDSSALKGSYNELVNQMGALKKVWRETTDEAVRADYGAQINALNTQLKQLDATTGNYQRNVGDYKNQLKQAKAELAQLTEGTQAYNDKLAECAEIAHNLKEQQTLIKNSSKDLGDQLANVTQIGTGMVAGFSALNAAMGLFGKQGSDIQKAMLKVQQSMQLVQGLKGMEGMMKKAQQLSTALGLVKATTIENTVVTEANTVAEGKNAAAIEASALATGKDAVAKGAQATATKGATVAQKGLNAAMKANPLGVVLAAVMALVSAYVLLKDKIDALINPQKAAAKQMREDAAARAKDLNDYIKYNEAKRGSDYKWTQEGRKYELERLNANIASYEKDTEEYKQAVRDKIEYERLYSERLNSEIKERKEKRASELEDLKNEIKDITTSWEDMVSGIIQSDKEAIYQTNKDRIDSWNDFIYNTMGPNQGKGLLLPSKSTFTKQLKELLDITDKSFIKPVIERVETDEGLGQLTNKSIQTIKNARKAFEGAMMKDALSELYRTQLDAISKEESAFKASIEKQSIEFKRSLLIAGGDVNDNINQLKNIFDQRSDSYHDIINGLLALKENVSKILGDTAGEYKDFFNDIDTLMYYYNTQMVNSQNEYIENASRLIRDAVKTENDAVKKDLEDDIKDIENTYAKYASETDLLGFANGSVNKEYNKMVDQAYEAKVSGYTKMLENLEVYLDEELYEEELSYEQKIALQEEYNRLKAELEDIELQHTIDKNERTRENFITTYNVIKDSLQATADRFGKWGDFYADIIDANVKQNKISQKDAEKQYKVVQGIQTAQAIVNTLAASMGAYQSLASIPYVGPALGAAAAATTLAYGYAQVRQIQATNPYSTDTNEQSAPTVSTPSIDEYSPVRTTNITGAMETEALANAMRSTPLWISVTDIDRAQSQVRLKDKESSF